VRGQIRIHRGLGDSRGLGAWVRRMMYWRVGPWGELRLTVSARFLTAGLGLSLSCLWGRRSLPCEVPLSHHSGRMIRIFDEPWGTHAQCKQDA
jgi:hypothetical protein